MAINKTHCLLIINCVGLQKYIIPGEQTVFADKISYPSNRKSAWNKEYKHRLIISTLYRNI